MSLDPNVALATRRDLARLRDRHDELLRALASVRDAENAECAVDLAFELGVEFGGVAGVGELASRRGDERESLLLAATDTDEERRQARALADAAREGRVFRALRHVLPSSFRSATLDAADRYRERLQALPERPLWPGSNVTLRDVYVPPACRLELRATNVDEGGDVDVEIIDKKYEDPVDAMRAHLRERPSTTVFLVGEPGAGISTTLRMFAADLANDRDWLPIAYESATPSSERLDARSAFEMYLGEPMRTWFDAELLPPVVQIVDGHFVRDSSSAIRGDALIQIAGRGWRGRWMPDGDVLELLPFDHARVRRWIGHWNSHAATPLDAEKLLASFPDDEPLSLNLAATPFTLALLARMVSAGHELPRSSRLRDRAIFYRDVITWVCSDANGAPGSRDELRHAAEASLRDAPRGLVFGAKRFGPFKLDRLSLWWDDERGAPRFPLVAEEGNNVAFFHESFAEYLVAERLAFECHRLRSTSLDVGGTRRPAGEEIDLARRWLRAFGLVTLDASLESLLRVMIPTWESFVLGSRRTPPGFAESWSALVTTIYRQLAADSAWAFVVDIAAELAAPPSVVRARSLFSLLRLGGLVDPSRNDLFEPERALPGSFAGVLSLLRGSAAALPDSSLEGSVSLRDAQCSLMNFAGADLAGVDFTGAQLVRADLRGADLRRAVLDRANLRRARLDGAMLDGATLTDTVLTHATVSGVRFSDAQRASAAWTHEDAVARGLPAEEDASRLGF